MAEFAHAMRARDHAHAAVAGVDLIERYPRGHGRARADGPVLAVLVPRHFEAGRRGFAEDSRGPQDDVRAEQGFDEIDQQWMCDEVEELARERDAFGVAVGGRYVR